MRVPVLIAVAAMLTACEPAPVHELPQGHIVVPPPGYLRMCADPETWRQEDCPNARP